MPNVVIVVDAHGVGSAISSAPPIDFTADIKALEGKPIAKRGRIPGGDAQSAAQENHRLSV